MSLIRTLTFISEHPLNRDQKLKAILNFFIWQVKSSLFKRDIVFNWINGSKIISRKGETAATGNIYCGLYSFPEMAYVLHSVLQSDLFVDIGSNIGCFTILACAVKGARGYCFEPVPSTYDRLITNLKINGLSDRVRPFNIGLSDKEGTLYFTDQNNTTNRVVRDTELNTEINKVKVKTIPLDTILSEDSPTILKIDVEGYETPVLMGSKGTLAKESLNSVIIRLQGHGARYGYDEKEIFSCLRSFGFNQYNYDPFHRNLELVEETDLEPGNCIFIRNLTFARKRILEAEKIFVSGKLI